MGNKSLPKKESTVETNSALISASVFIHFNGIALSRVLAVLSAVGSNAMAELQK